MIHIIILFIKKLLLLCRRIFMPHRRISVPLDEDGLQPMFSGFLHGVWLGYAVPSKLLYFSFNMLPVAGLDLS